MSEAWSPTPIRNLQAKFRRAVLKRDHEQCTYVNEYGQRFPQTTDLRACHHPKPLRDYGPEETAAAYDPQNGRTLCKTHDLMLDSYAR